MKAIIRIYDVGIWQEFGKADLPLAVGVSSEGGILFGKDTESDPVAWFGFSNHSIFLQPGGGEVSTQLNGKKLTDSAWLLAGDELLINNYKFKVEIDASVVVLSSVPQRKVPILTPPKTPLMHTTQNNDVSSVPTEQEPVTEKLAENEQGHSLIEEPILTPPKIPSEHTEKTKDVGFLPLEDEAVKTKLTESKQNYRQPDISTDTTFARLPGKQISSRLRNSIIAIFVFILLCVIFVLIAAPIRISITPIPESFSLSGFPPPIKIGDRYLALPGSYHVIAQKKGYRKLKELIKVKYGSDSSFAYNLLELPGFLEVRSQPVIGAEVLVNGNVVGKTPLSSIALEVGSYELSVIAQRYLPEVQLLDIQGKGIKQSIDVTLQPGWGILQIESEPEGADVLINGVNIGKTPLKTGPMAGNHKIELLKNGWQPIVDNAKIEPGVTLTMPLFKLKKIAGKLELTSKPTGASVMINSEFRGDTPVLLDIISEKDHQLSLSKSGFITKAQSIRVEPGKTMKVDVELQPEYGTVFITCQPADAELKIDGIKVNGFASQRLRLTTIPHNIEVGKIGYESFSTSLTPIVNVAKKLNIQLRSERQVKKQTVQPEIKTAEGQVLRRILLSEPVIVQMGASRRESGRRSNETQYKVELTRTFDISEKEVTNAEFQKFRQGHDSGSVSGFDLNEMDQPVSLVSWDDAVAYLNWLSQKDGFPPAYEEKDGKMVAISPLTTGYRLPTEAEWAFVARYEGVYSDDKKPLRYPWGSSKKPQEKSGNYADSSAFGNLPVIIKDYTDGYRVASPVGKFQANASGVYDLGGNVSEWCHDYYDVHLGSQTKVLSDPTGPVTGKYHVVRGASWRHGSIIELRLSYREYDEKPRNDLGFRIARYAE